MNPHRIYILHIAYRDTGIIPVPYHFILYFLPAGNTAFNQYLMRSGEAKSVSENFLTFFLILSDSSTTSAQRVCRS